MCRLRFNCADRYLENLLWEYVNDPGVRGSIRRARGFCHEHAWILAGKGSALGVAIIADDVFQGLLRMLESASREAIPSWTIRRLWRSLIPRRAASIASALAARLSPQSACPACAQAGIAEQAGIGTLLESLAGEGTLMADYERSEGLCLPHFRQALSEVRDGQALAVLVRLQRAIWDRLARQLRESIRKSDYRFQGEPWGGEAGAWRRALAALSGPCLGRGG